MKDEVPSENGPLCVGLSGRMASQIAGQFCSLLRRRCRTFWEESDAFPALCLHPSCQQQDLNAEAMDDEHLSHSRSRPYLMARLLLSDSFVQHLDHYARHSPHQSLTDLNLWSLTLVVFQDLAQHLCPL